MPVKFEQTELEGVTLCIPQVFCDARGFFLETYHAAKYMEGGVRAVFVQDNRSCSTRGVLRGLHYQLHKPQAKLVTCIRGEIYDVAVDIRRGSPTFGKWSAAVLSETNHHQLFIPGGFAHGFCVLSETAEIMYKCSEFYDPRDDRGVRWNDPSFGIGWPVAEPVLSAKDAVLPFLRDLSEEQLPKHGHEKNKGD
ncbi:MAG TPA: dTDP-4-dehydrorhamnose 3,5-epimerase [Kiritimatiellia bacterium]|nr:dTDP-4-dehydrorhamnose 3,5-epimerase [Kiritimatiellia bacterium]HPS05894.1 dTDP-4-dehydrorhamnose 3,5-epimerase [Kiritimatiellia bacterium]